MKEKMKPEKYVMKNYQKEEKVKDRQTDRQTEKIDYEIYTEKEIEK